MVREIIFGIPRNDEWSNDTTEANVQLNEMCQDAGIDFLDYRNHLHLKRHLNSSKFHRKENGSAKLSCLFFNYVLEKHQISDNQISDMTSEALKVRFHQKQMMILMMVNHYTLPQLYHLQF